MRRIRWLRDAVLRRLKPGTKAKVPAQPPRYPPNEKLAVREGAYLKGHVFDADLLSLEAAARAHHPKQDWGPEYEVVRGAFDPLFYLSQHDDIRDQALDPVGHYLRAGAREGRDPTPWFSTDEYRRAYLKDGPRGQQAINPFYHYLTAGRAAGHAPRTPANYKGFCNELGLSPAQTSDLVTQRMADVRTRLRHGALGDMVMKAADLDPLIAQSWKAGLKVRVPPASNAIGVRRIGHLIDLQHQAARRRARAVIVVERAQLLGNDSSIEHVFEHVIAGAGADETVVVMTDSLARGWDRPEGVRMVDFQTAMPRTKGYQAGRTLIEFIRSLRPEVVINLNAGLMNRALRAQGKAVAANSVVYQYLPQGIDRPKTRAVLGSKYYRAIDLHQRVIVANTPARVCLVETFSLPAGQSELIWTAQEGPDHGAYDFGADDG